MAQVGAHVHAEDDTALTVEERTTALQGDFDTLTSDYADALATIEELQETSDAVNNFFEGPSPCIYHSDHKCWCADQEQMHPLLVKEDDEGNTESVELLGKVFSPAEILLLKEDLSSTGGNTYNIFKAIDAKTLNCEYRWVTNVDDKGRYYTGQVDDSDLKSGVGLVDNYNSMWIDYSTWVSNMKHGFHYYIWPDDVTYFGQYE